MPSSKRTPLRNLATGDRRPHITTMMLVAARNQKAPEIRCGLKGSLHHFGEFL